VPIPRYLERAQIVTRGTNDKVEISEYRRWAEPLESGIAEVLADNLAAQVGSERVAVFPWRGATARAPDYRVVVVVLRFDGSPGRRVTLDVIGTDPVVANLHVKHPVIHERPDLGTHGLRVLDDIRERLGDDEVRASFDVRREPLRRNIDLNR